MQSRSGLARGAALVAIAHAVLAVALRSSGFDHVSDDDFARVTIAQSFAVAPRLDPSGTSWLPFPFWLTGGPMTLFGRSLGVAVAVSIVACSVIAAMPYVALRTTGSPRLRALLATAFALLSPWGLWLGASTVPESITASLTAGAVIALGGTALPRPKTALVFAIGLVAASLSRYEVWPVAAVLAVRLALRARKDRRLFGLSILAAIGPLAWMAWNAYAHGNPLHFFHRVANFKRAVREAGDTSGGSLTALFLYPLLLAKTRPDVLVATAICAWTERVRFGLRRLRADEGANPGFTIPVLCALAQLGFLAYGNLRDGAPTHHPERAVVGTGVILALASGDLLLASFERSSDRARAFLLALVVSAWLFALRPLFGAPPGSTPSEDRRAQIAEGMRLRSASHLVVTPCAYEHFALVAAFGAPERVEVRPKRPDSASCPAVEAAP